MARNELYDFYKALLMFGVVWGHTITNLGGGDASCNITWFLRLYDMPFFMLISGYFLSFSVKKESIKGLLLDKTTTILLPALLWSIIISRRFVLYYSGYYFLYAVFFSSLTVILVERLCNQDKMRWLKWVSYSSIIIALYLIDNKPFNLCYLFPFFLLGYKNDNWYKYRLFWFVLFVSGACFWKNSFNIWNADTNMLHGYSVVLINIYRLVLGCAAIAVMRMVFDMAYMFFKTSNPSVISLISETIGRETLGLYISHVFVINLIKHGVGFLETNLGYNPFLFNARFLVYCLAPFISIIILFSCYKVIELCKRNRYLKYLWGSKMMITPNN